MINSIAKLVLKYIDAGILIIGVAGVEVRSRFIFVNIKDGNRFLFLLVEDDAVVAWFFLRL